MIMWAESLVHFPNMLLQIPTFFYYKALKRNTLDAIQAISDEPDADRRNELTYQFLRFKIAESKYVQVAVSGTLGVSRSSIYHAANSMPCKT